ncbi:DUF4118 domain-containing protein [Roseomonas sp. GCM10028921]
MVYLLTAVAASVAFGPAHGLSAAVLSFLCWNFLLIESRYTLTIDGPNEIVEAVVFGLRAHGPQCSSADLRTAALRRVQPAPSR